MQVVLHPSYAEAPPKLVADALCLDFLNTVEWRGDPAAQGERLTSYGELALWAGHAGAVPRSEVAELRKDAAARPAAAAAALDSARTLRAALERLFLVGRSTDPVALGLLNELLARMPQRLVPAAGEGCLWSAAGEPLERPLWPVVRSAAELLTDPERRARLRRCSDDRCGWVFLDRPGKRRRLWCSMESCGNRAKARRHYQRSRSS